MSSQWLEVAGLPNKTWRFTRWARPRITWWPTSLPGTEMDERPRRRRAATPARRRYRRGRIQLLAG